MRTAVSGGIGLTQEQIETIYLSGAGGLGNIGAEAIFLAIILQCQRYWPQARFVLSAWRPDRVRLLLQGLRGRFEVIPQSTPLDRPRNLRAADLFLVCGDVALTETVIPILPLFWSAKALWARLHGARVVFLGIEVEPIRRWLNRGVIRLVLNRVVRPYVVRNDDSRAVLVELGADPAVVLVGCEPALMITDEELVAFPAPTLDRHGAALLVGFGIRDHFSEPLKLDIRRAKLSRRDTEPGELSSAMKETVRFLARQADRLIERHGARVVFIPHHCLTGEDKVILTDREVAERIVAEMRHPEGTTILPENMHPFTVMNVYRQLDLVVSMRHHANSFAYRFGVPTVGCAISEKVVRHFRQVQQESLLVEPRDPDPDRADRVVDDAIRNRHVLSEELKKRLIAAQSAMDMALAAALGGGSQPAAR
jgi:polysaccharide pyruvyl transferase WcaK-like protein